MNYSTEIKVGIENGIFKAEDIYDFRGSPFEALLGDYYIFCRDSLNIHSKHTEISPNIFLLTNNFSVNAKAGRTADHYFIAINLGLLKYCNDNYIENPALQTYFEAIFPNTISKFDNPAGLMAFQICTQFTYYHELAHLFQLSSHAGVLSIQERNDENEKEIFFKIDHVLEINADIYASVCEATHIEQYIGRIFKNDVTFQNTCETYIFFCCCLFHYTLGFSKTADPIYFDQHTHPHSFLRLVNCILNIIHHVEKSQYFGEKGIDLKSANLFMRVVTIYKELEQKGIFKTNVSEIFENNRDFQKLMANYLHTLIQSKTTGYANAMDVWNKHII